jgi:hypothetical protein
MASPRTSEREEERRHKIRTLLVASSASATAAAVTSQLWIAGTWIAAAATPVLVTLISELLNRPTEKIVARALTADRPALAEPPPLPEAGGAAPPPPARRGAPPAREARPARDIPPATPGVEPPVRIYRQPSPRAPRRKIALGAVFAMAGLAFVIAVVTLTAGELIAGDSIGQGDRRTTFGGGSRDGIRNDKEEKAPVDEQRDQTTEERPPERQERTTPQQEQQPTETETETTETQPPATTTTPAPRAAPAPATPGETAPAP